MLREKIGTIVGKRTVTIWRREEGGYEVESEAFEEFGISAWPVGTERMAGQVAESVAATGRPVFG